MVDDDCVLEIWYDKDAKNKVRSFYRQYYRLVNAFFDHLETPNNQQVLMTLTKEKIIQKMKDFKLKHFKEEE